MMLSKLLLSQSLDSFHIPIQPHLFDLNLKSNQTGLRAPNLRQKTGPVKSPPFSGKAAGADLKANIQIRPSSLTFACISCLLLALLAYARFLV
jgi:hypothetical protein